MDFKKIMAREISKTTDGKVIYGNKIGNIYPSIEWFKWLSYIPEFEKERIEYLDSKKISELSYEELEEASIYIRNKIFTRLFRIYGTSECSEEDRIKVFDFMHKESIEKLMLSKLTSEELQYAKQEITRLCKTSKEQLHAKVTEESKPENYAQLSMVDSYILHIISNINYVKNMEDLRRVIDAQLERNGMMRYRSSYNTH